MTIKHDQNAIRKRKGDSDENVLQMLKGTKRKRILQDGRVLILDSSGVGVLLSLAHIVGQSDDNRALSLWLTACTKFMGVIKN